MPKDVCACVCVCVCEHVRVLAVRRALPSVTLMAVTAPDHTDCVLLCLQDGSTETERAAGWWRVQTSVTLATAH